MPVEVKGAVALRKALRQFEPDLAKETNKELADFARPVTAKAKGYVPSKAPLSGWGIARGIWENRTFDSAKIKRGITFSTAPTKPNRNGFRSVATIYNKSAAGAIYETAGRKNPNGQPSQASTRGKYSSYIDTSKNVNKSANPNAGKQFIDAMGQIYKAERAQGQGGRVSRKMNGRLIFRAYAEDEGKARGNVIKAIEKSAAKLNARSKI